MSTSATTTEVKVSPAPQAITLAGKVAIVTGASRLVVIHMSPTQSVNTLHHHHHRHTTSSIWLLSACICMIRFVDLNIYVYQNK
jgi:hypothetical protein